MKTVTVERRDGTEKEMSRRQLFEALEEGDWVYAEFNAGHPVRRWLQVVAVELEAHRVLADDGQTASFVLAHEIKEAKLSGLASESGGGSA